MNITPKMGDKLNSVISDIQSPDRCMTLGLVDIVNLWPYGRTYLAATTAENIFIEFKGYHHSKTMIANLKYALGGLVENSTVEEATIKCSQIDEHSCPNEIDFKVKTNVPYEEILQMIGTIDELPEEKLYYFEAKMQSKDLQNKKFTGYLEYATTEGGDNKIVVMHNAFLLETL